VFGLDAPPLHDPLAIAFAIDDSLFETRFLNVEVEMGSSLCFGQTVADVDRITERPPNVHVATKVDVAKFWNLMIHACEQAVQKEERGKE
jgi:inosine-uridine nucleoside N-ribohydrolase